MAKGKLNTPGNQMVVSISGFGAPCYNDQGAMQHTTTRAIDLHELICNIVERARQDDKNVSCHYAELILEEMQSKGWLVTERTDLDEIIAKLRDSLAALEHAKTRLAILSLPSELPPLGEGK